MKPFLFLIVFVLYSSIAFAAPFVLSDPYQVAEIQPSYFLLYIDGSTTPTQINIAKDTNNLIVLYYDIGMLNLPYGNHTVSARAGNGMGVSDITAAVPFTLSEIIPPPREPTGLRILLK